MTKAKLLSTVCLGAMMLSAPSAAQASEPTAPPAHVRQWYATAFGGYAFSWDHEFDFVSIATGNPFHYHAPLDNGYVFGGAIGVIANRNIRVEVEVAYSTQDFINTYQAAGFVGQNPSGSLNVTTVTLNAWYNTHWGHWMPYVGGGMGVGFVDGDLRITNGAGQQFNGSDTGFAFLLGAGVRVPIASNIELDIGYRLRTVLDINLGSSIAGFNTTSENITTQAVQAGLTFRF